MDQLLTLKDNNNRTSKGFQQQSTKSLFSRGEWDLDEVSRERASSSSTMSSNSIFQHSFTKTESTGFYTLEASDRMPNHSRKSLVSFGQSQAKSESIICGICKKPFARKNTVLKHLRDKHSYELLSQIYPLVRKCLMQVGQFSQEQYFNQHNQLINQIKNSDLELFPIPEQLRNRMNKKFFTQAKKKYEEFNILYQKKNIKFYKISNQKQITSISLLERSTLQSFKNLTLTYVIQFQRYYQPFIKNISLSDLLIHFCYNFSFNISKCKANFLNFELMQLFSSVLIHFEKWINKNYLDVFNAHKVMHYHIRIGKDTQYCQKERTWKIDLLIRQYLRQIKNNPVSLSELKLANFILICFHEYVTLEGLEV